MEKCLLNQPNINKLFFDRDNVCKLLGQVYSETAFMFFATGTIAYIFGKKAFRPALTGGACVVNVHLLSILDHQHFQDCDRSHSLNNRLGRLAVNIVITACLTRYVIKTDWKWAVFTPSAMAYYVEYSDK